MTLTSRRNPPGEHPDTIASQSWEGARRTIARWLRWTKDNWSGIPGGFAGTTPNTVTVGGTADPGDENQSWMAANAQLVLDTGTPADLGSANAEGSSEAAPRLDHVHKRAIETTQGGYVRRRLNFKTGFTVSDDSGDDEIEIEVTSAISSGSSRKSRADYNDYVLFRVVHAESFIVAQVTGKI